MTNMVNANDFNPPPSSVPTTPLPEFFEDQVRRTPEATALVFGQDRVTYAVLEARANRLAHLLLVSGAGPEVRIGISLERSVDFVTALLAILKAGSAYVPLDPGAPAAHLARMVADADPLVTLTNAGSSEHLPGSTRLLFLDAKATDALLARQSSSPPDATDRPAPLEPDSPAWVIYTSGSTGSPKGVLGTVRGLVNRLHWSWEEYPYGDVDVCCQKTSLNFIDHLVEILAPLLRGVPLVIVNDRQVRDPAVLVEELARERVTRLVVMPSLLRRILRQPETKLQDLTAVSHWFSSGEALTLHLARKFFAQFPQARLVNVYGSTEVSADATARSLGRGDLEDLLDYFRVDEAGGRGRNVAITTEMIALEDLKARFGKTAVPVSATSFEDYNARLESDVLPYVVDTNSPRFIGHMTSALPSFMHDFSGLISRLNLNVVKVETSKSLTFLERETLSMLHGSFYGLPDAFYERHKQDPGSQLGLFTSGGSIANLTALWCARNRALPGAEGFPGVGAAGMAAALEHGGFRGAAIVCSRLAHYSVAKAASILGLGTEQVVHVAQEATGPLDLEDLEHQLDRLHRQKICVLAIIGLGGATETGTIDPLEGMAEIAAERGLHFHVDAAWGAPLIFSAEHRHLLAGIERADSITMCGHKQFYLPMGVSLCLFRDPTALGSIATAARYQALEGSFDMGRYSPEGSRSALSLCFHAALHLIGRAGYARLMDDGIRRARYLEEKIRQSEAFELLGCPRINIVNYRYIPRSLRAHMKSRQPDGGQISPDDTFTPQDQAWIDECNILLQRSQFLEGSTFISHTRMSYPEFRSPTQVVTLRAVLANPLTSYRDIDAVLANQLAIATREIERAPSSPEVPPAAEAPSYDLLALRKHTAAIGTPLANTCAYVLNARLEPVPVREVGELYVAGAGLARGYLGQPRWTAEYFLPDPLGEEPGGRMYRTGDRVRWQTDGDLYYLGRVDQQMKIGGFRIEPGEIEAVLTEHPAVLQAAVISREGPGGARLVACVVVSEEVEPEVLRRFLAHQLPEHMVPASIRQLESLPLTPNGKLDRMALRLY